MGQEERGREVELKQMRTGKEPYICPKSAPVRKIVTLLLAALISGSGLMTTSCARRTTQQKKTASYKRKAKSGKAPCPCDSH
jgi:hypothetical protein